MDQTESVNLALLIELCAIDFEPAFHWNSKQFFVYIVAEYESISHVSIIILRYNLLVKWTLFCSYSPYAFFNISIEN